MAKPVTLPTSVDELSREGLLWLVKRAMFVARYDLNAARHHELELAENAAIDAWRASLAEAEKTRRAYMDLLAEKGAYTARGEKALRAARDAMEAADTRQDRLWKASQAAMHRGMAFFRLWHPAPATDQADVA